MEIFAVLCFGLCYGSFLNVLIRRLPQGLSILWPGSHCPRCLHPIAFYDNIPLLSWVLLRGRCRFCREPISAHYPVVEALMGGLALALWRRAEGANWPATAAAILASGIYVAIAAIDWDTFLIPDELSLGLLGAGLLISPVNPLLASDHWYLSAAHSALGAALGFALCWGVAEAGFRLFKKEAMGGGDIKLLAAIGAWSGATGAFDALMIGSLLGSVYGLILIARGKLTRSEPIPFGPFLSIGAIFNFFYLLPLGFPFVV